MLARALNLNGEIDPESLDTLRHYAATLPLQSRTPTAATAREEREGGNS
jgi:hypothetical protein